MEFRLLREHIISRQAYQHGIGQWFGGRMLDVFLLLSVSSGLQDGARMEALRETVDSMRDNSFNGTTGDSK